MSRIEPTILASLIFNEKYARKVTPFLKSEYFSDKIERTVATQMIDFFNKYNKPANKEIIKIELTNQQELSDEELWSCMEKVEELIDTEPNQEWIIDTTEKFCKDKAVYNAIMESIRVFDGSNKNATPDSIPKLLQDALAVSFDTRIGSDYLEDAEKRFEFYHELEEKLPFDLTMFNKITNGGLNKKSMCVLLAGCVHPDTEIIVRILDPEGTWRQQKIKIGTVEELLKTYDLLVESPDGFIKINYFVDKGIWKEYVLNLDNGDSIRCNANHKFETTLGMVYAKDLVGLPPQHFLTRYGYELGEVITTDNNIPIVDINVDHPNHRYYTSTVSSSNTGSGKSLVMCHMASAAVLSGKNVLYITMEMAEERIAERVDANLMNIPINELREIDKSRFDNKINNIKKKVHGSLIIKEFPTASAHSGHFRALIEELKVKKEFLPDLIIIDYLNICASARIKAGMNANSYTLVKAVAEELRGLAVEYNVPIITASQVGRQAQTSSDMEITDVSDSMGIGHVADLVLSLIRSEELDELNQIMVKQLKNRFGSITDYRRFVVGVDRPKMKLYDLENSAQVNITDSGQADTKPLVKKDISKFSSFTF